LLRRVDMGDIADVSKPHSVSIFSVEVWDWWGYVCIYIRSCFEETKEVGKNSGDGASSAPLRRVDRGNCVFDPCKGCGMHEGSHQQLMLCGGHSSKCPAGTTACDGRMGTLWRVCDEDCYVIIRYCLGYIRSIFVLFICWWEIETLSVRKVACRECAVPWHFILSQMNAVQSLPSYCLKTWFCIILSLTFSSP
jgi:hypothetical protein